jgi:geranylgeranyl diphosphate synthase type I
MTAVMPESLDASRTMVEPAVRAVLDRLDPETRQVAGYHLGYWDETGRPGALGGKAMRGAFALLSARAAGATAERGLPGAVAVELVHNFSLIHDDVMDRDTERRHRPTAWTVFGTSAAILAGDVLLSTAAEVLGEADEPQWAVRCLLAATRRLIAGQAADLRFEERDDVGLDECVAMARDKTASLLSCATSIGAVLAAAPAALTMGLAAYGDHLGLAFQLVDDLLGIWGDPAATGKPVGSDLLSRKKSLPVVAALTAGDPSADELRELYREPITEADVPHAAELVAAAGGRDWAETEASRQLDLALSRLDALDIPDDVLRELTELAHFVTGRDR